MIFSKQTNKPADLAAIEIELNTRLRGKLEELQSSEQALGEAYLAGDVIAIDVPKLRAEAIAIESAITVIRRRRVEAIVKGNQAKARDLRRDAAAKASEAAGIEQKASRLLSSLSELEGVAFTSGGYEPMSLTLRGEAASLNREANELEAKGIPSAGIFDNLGSVISDEAIISGVLCHPSAGPTAAAVVAWLADVQAENKGLHGANLETFDRRVRIVWKDGVIDRSASYVYVKQMSPELPGVPGCFDVERATFRAAAA
jgi:hypothetical protein